MVSHSNFNLEDYKNIHFIGIGGAGMCPMAEILNAEGFNISGSDMGENENVLKLKNKNVEVYIGHNEENIGDVDLVVYSAAVKPTNPEMIEATSKNIMCIERSTMLGVLTDRYNRCIAVSGTHGKTSTTAMITQILIGSGFDPSAIIGGKLPYIGGNSYIGHSDIIVCEACEYVNSFLKLNPAISVILNIDADHLDFFKDLEDIKNSFEKFSNQTKQVLVVNGDDSDCRDVVKNIDTKKIFFGFDESNDYYAENLSFKGSISSFDLMHNGEKITTITLNVPGKHNVLNALASICVAIYLGADISVITENINKFGGVHRRFEILGTPCGITVADDFAHHPTELTATLNATMDMKFNNVWAVFQPHTFSRTAMLLDDFATSLSIPDNVVISKILPVREENTYNIYAEDLVAKIDGGIYLETFEEITDFVCKNAKENDLIITLGGGDVYKCANMIYKKLSNKELL